jgi:hypothetical protein
MSGSDTRSGRNIIGVFAMVIERIVTIGAWVIHNPETAIITFAAIAMGVLMAWAVAGSL